jgi:hypothetical protein
VSSEQVYPGQTWHRRSGGGAVRVHIVDGQRIGFRKADGAIGYMALRRFVAVFRREVR